MTIDLKAMLAAKTASTTAKDDQRQEAQVESKFKIFYGEFPPYQNYLTAAGKVVQFYQGYCMTDDPEVIAYCQSIRDAKEVTGEVQESDVPVPAKRDRNRNWASAAPSAPHIFNPAELLQRAVANSSNTMPAMRSDSSN